MDAALSTIREVSKKSRKIRFEGDSYSKEWQKEAERRGIVKAHTIPEGIDLFLEPKSVKMLGKLGIFTHKELEAYHTIRLQSFVNTIEIELSLLHDMIFEGFVPSISKQLKLEQESMAAIKDMRIPNIDAWKKNIEMLATAKASILVKTKELELVKDKRYGLPLREHADILLKEALPLAAEIRKLCDSVEIYISKENLAYPKYRALLSLSTQLSDF